MNLIKANAIFNYVKNTFTWNKDAGLYVEDGIKKMLETKTGNATEINLFLVMLLREAGIKADPLAISTVSIEVHHATVFFCYIGVPYCYFHFSICFMLSLAITLKTD